MALDSKARAVLFGTPILSRQIHKCVKGKGSISKEELRSIFPDVETETFNHTLRNLKNQGVLEHVDGMVSYREGAPDPHGSQADRAWKAACLLKSFKLDELCRAADITWSYAQRTLARWCSKGLAVKSGASLRGAPAVWTMVGGNPNSRPITRRK